MIREDFFNNNTLLMIHRTSPYEFFSQQKHPDCRYVYTITKNFAISIRTQMRGAKVSYGIALPEAIGRAVAERISRDPHFERELFDNYLCEACEKMFGPDYSRENSDIAHYLRDKKTIIASQLDESLNAVNEKYTGGRGEYYEPIKHDF